LSILQRLKKYFETPRPIIVVDWFADRPPRRYPIKKILPKRCRSEHFEIGVKSLVEGELLVNLTERRVFQKLDRRLVEWKQVNEHT